MSIAYRIDDIRNVALAGHGASGKTSLADALLHAAGESPRRGSVDDGTSAVDTDDEEKRRHFSIDAHLMHLEWGGRQVHLIDSPGAPDFIGTTLGALSAVENVVIAVAGPSGIEVNTRRTFAEAGKLGLGRFVAITKMDADHVDYAADLEAIRSTFGPMCVPFNLPIGQGAEFRGLVDVFDPPDDVPEGCPMHPREAQLMLVEAIVETDEDLMARYLDGGEIGPDELRGAACRAIAGGRLVPVVCLSTRRDVGLRELLDLVAACGVGPGSIRRHGRRDDHAEDLDPIEDGELVAQVFKTTNDAFAGKLSHLRIHSGRLSADAMLMNLRTGKTARPGHIYRLQGRRQDELREAIAGDIVAVPKFDDLHIGDTVTTPNGRPDHLALDPIAFPTPMVPRAVEPRSRDDDAKLSAVLDKLADEDPTLLVRRDPHTHELVISGMSELHLDVVQRRLSSRYHMEVSTHVPNVPYLETVAAEAEAQHRHKKQTGGRGQFADVSLRVRPLPRGAGLRFVDAVKGGVIPSQYIPAVEKGVREQVARGVVSGNQVVDIEVEVYFGSAHAVDSSEHAFKAASAAALRKAVEAARPMVLEPIVAVEIVVPLASFGDVTADLATRRGHITGMETLPAGMQLLRATAPLAEVLRYATDLGRMTGGRGTFTMEYWSYEPVPPNAQQTIVGRWSKMKAHLDED